MKAQELQVKFERNMNHNYMILCKQCFFETYDNENEYCKNMLLKNNIPGLLSVTYRENCSEKNYYYEINSLQSMENMYEKAEINFYDLGKLLKGCIQIFENLEEYLLDGRRIVLNPAYIYLKPESKEPLFVYYPEYDEDIRESFRELMDYILTKIDHNDEKAVVLGYQVYRYTRLENYTIQEIRSLLCQTEIENNIDKSFEYINDSIEDDVTDKADFEKENENEKDSLYECDRQQSSVKIKTKENKSRISNLFGGFVCVLIALCSGFMLIGARILLLLELSYEEEMYLCGAMTMSLMAGAIFFVCYRKNCYKNKQEVYNYETDYDSPEFEYDIVDNNNFNDFSMPQKEPQVFQCAPTTCLSDNQFRSNTFHELKGVVEGRDFQMPLTGFPVVIGKLASLADCVIDDNTVSRVHARLEQENGIVYLTDLNSTNGTARNGEMLEIHRKVPLNSGDKLQFGKTTLIFT